MVNRLSTASQRSAGSCGTAEDAPTMEFLIAPSLLSANFADVGGQVRMVEEAGADWLHCDVMDGHFVPNLTIGPFIIQAIKSVAKKPLDVHIMIENPEKYASDFCKAGADMLTFHIEAAQQPRELAQAIRALGVRPAVAISPDTAVEAVFPVLDLVDMVLVMTVYPGFGGQSFLERCLSKVRTLRNKAGEKLWIEVDGGLTLETVRAAAAAGANVIVAGTAIFKAPDQPATIKELRARARASYQPPFKV